MASNSVAAAPWRSPFLSHIEKMEPPTFVLSTLHPVESSSSSTPSFVPRSRTVVFRGLWASLPTNPKNTAELNPDVYETDLLTITSDARMEKVSELFKSASGAVSQSGGGGPVEATIWAVEARTQWRVRGQAYVLGPDIDSDATAPVRKAIEEHMRSRGDTDSWSWSRELTAHFGNLSPVMRGSFKNPPPGTPLSEKPGPGLELGQKVDNLDDEIARQNFRVVVIVPQEVDRVDLSDPAKATRWNYKLAKAGIWDTTELWP
ncbi:Fc.00g087130.m01.CDS01 [Cosmosporella sp. VM-42]